jgi:intracellular septation protein
MQLLVDFFPVIVFFVVYKIYDIYVATAAIIVAMAVQIAYQWFRHRKVSKMLLVSGVLVAVFGGITLGVRDPVFIQWKPTVVNWLFAVAFLASQYVAGGKTLVERIMGEAVQLPPATWRHLNLVWVANFLVLGAANLYVVYNFDEQTWVNFKLFGFAGITFLTALGQALWIASRTSQRSESES